ncbi:MAG TPA: hypothetical protein VGV37_23750 [Aliidongia sp.]|uniref:hypothetical protein n=1 Tax=Aliidongia sp. TaxID=1914230 RepID=UPI002DDCAA44|nr:hypothetical protein [Aliidongia sp.]HEV2677565.1 hypothetical protein [Aliidongia sp.]
MILPAVLGLGACTAPPVPADLAPRFGEVKAHFVTGRDIDVIEVRALETSAIRAATLVMPDGSRVAAEQIDAEGSPRLPGAPTSGIGLSTTNTTLVGQIASAALIRLPEPPAYRRGWQGGVIEVTLGDGAGWIVERVAAPPPP